MEFINIPTEQTTAFTDAILGVISATSAVYLCRISQKDKWKTRLWVWLFGLIAFVSMLGAVAHGFKLSLALQTYLWHLLYLSLGLIIGIFMVAAVYDIWGETLARRILPIMLALGVGFFFITLIWPGSFLLFIVYKTVVMLFAFGGYLGIAYRGQLAGAWLMVAGIIVTIIAAGVQATKAFSFNFIWSFDHNGVYHLVQLLGVVFLVAGLKKALLSQT